MIDEQDRGQQLANAAAKFIGVRFLLHGRNPNEGLDCIGLVASSLIAIDCRPVIPCGYRLRNSDPEPWISCAQASGLRRTNSSIKAGDVLLIKPGPGQHHLVIAESTNLAIHAHAGVRKIVRQPMPLFDTKLEQWRLP